MRTQRVSLMGVAATLLLLAGLVPLAGQKSPAPKTAASRFTDADWPRYTGDLAGTRYSKLKQINTTNVSKLTSAWTFAGVGGEESYTKKFTAEAMRLYEALTIDLGFGSKNTYLLTEVAASGAEDGGHETAATSRRSTAWRAWSTSRWGPWPSWRRRSSRSCGEPPRRRPRASRPAAPITDGPAERHDEAHET